jgi:tRNA U34 5-carboxymethylaminomethyl modifying enzyme MnmG/GidA
MMAVSNDETKPPAPDENALRNLGDSEVKEVKEPATFSPASVYDTVEASIKYQSYVQRQYKDMESWRRAQGKRIPPDVVYDHAVLPTLSLEELEKLNIHRPNTFAEASQISGITPQSLVYLYHHIQQRNKKRDGKSARTQAQVAAKLKAQQSVQ